MSRIIGFGRRHGIALLALFVALSGTTYAASRYPANIIGPTQLKKDAVTSPKIKNGAVTGPKIAANSITGADVLESSLAQVPSAKHADTATKATSATTATTAATAASATNATNATNADQLGGVPASSYQRAITGTCANGTAMAAIASDGSVTCATQVYPVSISPGYQQVIDPPGPLSFLHIGVNCGAGGATIVSFVNTGPDAATLNWLYSNGTTVSASGVALNTNVPTNERDFDFNDKRIEGQFVFANGAGVTTVNLHAFDGNILGGCEIRGTAEFAP
jgi:hypothetical protein